MPEHNVGLVAVQPAAANLTVRRPSAKEQFAAFYKENYRTVLNTVMAAGGTWQEAEDAVAESMRDLLTKWKGVEKPLPYVRTAAVRALIKTREKDRHLRERLEQSASARSGSHVPDDGMTDWEDAEWVRQLLASIPPTQRAVLTLIYDQFSPQEIASLLGKKEGAIRQNLLEARRRGKQTLASMAATDRRSEVPDGPTHTMHSGRKTR